MRCEEALPEEFCQLPVRIILGAPPMHKLVMLLERCIAGGVANLGAGIEEIHRTTVPLPSSCVGGVSQVCPGSVRRSVAGLAVDYRRDRE